jgi:hypothetical protein
MYHLLNKVFPKSEKKVILVYYKVKLGQLKQLPKTKKKLHKKVKPQKKLSLTAFP